MPTTMLFGYQISSREGCTFGLSWRKQNATFYWLDAFESRQNGSSSEESAKRMIGYRLSLED